MQKSKVKTTIQNSKLAKPKKILFLGVFLVLVLGLFFAFQASSASPTCGDGIVTPPEQCDAGTGCPLSTQICISPGHPMGCKCLLNLGAVCNKNFSCEKSLGETAYNCASDCFCGNGTCDPGEDANNCPLECGAFKEKVPQNEIKDCKKIPYGQHLEQTKMHSDEFLPLLIELKQQLKDVFLNGEKMVNLGRDCKSENCEGNCECPKKEECKKVEKGCKTDNDCIPLRPMCNPSTGECGCTTPPGVTLGCQWCPPARCGLSGCSKENYKECLAKGLLPPPPPKERCSADKDCPPEKPKCDIATGECGCMTKSPKCAWCRPENCATPDCNKMFYEDCKTPAVKGEEGYKCVKPCQEKPCSGSPCPEGIREAYQKMDTASQEYKNTLYKLKLLEGSLDELKRQNERLAGNFALWYQERDTSWLYDCFTLKDMKIPNCPITECPFDGNTYYHAK